MRPSRLLLAALVSLRAVLIYGEVSSTTAMELTWRELLPARLRLPRAALPAAGGGPAPARALSGPST